jgi:hypothetical protein
MQLPLIVGLLTILTWVNIVSFGMHGSAIRLLLWCSGSAKGLMMYGIVVSV